MDARVKEVLDETDALVKELKEKFLHLRSIIYFQGKGVEKFMDENKELREELSVLKEN